MKRLTLVLAVMLALGLCAISSVQAAPPPGADIGAQGTRVRDEAEEDKALMERQFPKAAPVKVEEEKAPPVEAGGLTFLLKEVTIKGATLFTPKELEPYYKDYIGKTVSLRDLQAIADSIKAKYSEMGYLTTIVYVPDQNIAEGKIEIKVVEGKMGKLNIEGNKHFSSALLERYFHTRKGEMINVHKIVRDILRMNQNSDLEVKSVLSAGEEKGTSDVTLKVTETLPYHAAFLADNHGTRLTGKPRWTLLLYSTNLTDNMDSLLFNSVASQYSFGESLSYSIPLDTYGTKFALDLTYFKMRLAHEYWSQKIIGISEYLTPHFKKELYLSQDFQASADVGLDIRSIRKWTSGSRTSDDQLRVPYVALSFSATDNWRGQTTFTPQMSFGTSGFMGASARNHPSASREGTGGAFVKYEQGLNRVQAMPFESYLAANTYLQFASHTLPSSEQLQIGGYNSVRGYPEGDYLADWGGYLNSEWVFPCYIIPKDWKLAGQDKELRRQIQPFVFFDVGGGRLKKVNSGEKLKQTLMGAGGGLRIALFNNFSLKVEWAKHLGDEPTGGSGPSTFDFSFQASI